MDVQTLLTFAAAFFVFAASPGPDNLTIVSKTVTAGPAHGLAYGAGMVVSILGFVIFAAIGLNAVAQGLNEGFRFVQYAGAAYLIYTGVQMWRSQPQLEARAPRGGLGRLFATGFMLNLTNPKMPIFYLALLPGVLGTRMLTLADTLQLILVILLVELVVVGFHVFAAHRARHLIATPRRLRQLNRSAGALMAGAGVLVASR
ncbi:RhtB family transporter [Xaviernesmea oryzae]|uniref:RhtB family transporter n=1 Tax=Xaviernesmea oryzae TaxID=464029 RepID=A0A1Q9B009_9HYPH|nr:LysE family translocator [Xaviernesmea oryzae]OLP61328.1 RhtB family transporter [Xaviernesmea oryzae]SEL55265.1 Threonine/homoserine/homoserine lactone efflux protein [Xaviernesmea oryzae]